MGGNIFVNRLAERFGELDEADAVAFAETICENWRRVLSHEAPGQSVPAKRELNLALVFLNLKYPFQCCAAKPPCNDCPMNPWDESVQRGEPCPTPSAS